MGDGRDAFSEDVHIPVETTTEELLAAQGWCLWQCDALDGEIIALVRDESIKDVPEGYVVYTEAEMAEIGRFKVPQSTIRLVHESKKRHAATVQSVIPSPHLFPCHPELVEGSPLINKPSGGNT
jgi:hypothetical protein